MTHDQLLAFLAVAGKGSFGAAAHSLHKSQPAVSKLVRNLEAELGLELFDRTGYRAKLNASGRLFCERASAVIESTEALKSFAHGLAGQREAAVRLAVDAVTPLAPLLAVLRTIRAEFAEVRIELNTERMAGALEALAEGRAELVIARPVGLEPASMEAERFARVRLLAVAHSGHPLASAGSPVPLALLRRHPQIVLADSAKRGASPALNVLAGGLHWNVTDVAAKREMILAGMGWGGLPEHFIEQELRRGTLVELDVREFEADSMDLFLIRRRDRARGVVQQALWQGLLAAATELRMAAGPADSRSRNRSRTGPTKTRTRKRA
jgi:DNA-binding transcriptional LysR family regulator